jgi:hypothetical protein
MEYIYKDRNSQPIPLVIDTTGTYWFNEKTKLLYKGQTGPYSVYIEGTGWDEGDHEGYSYRTSCEVIVYYNDDSELLNVIDATKKLILETSFTRNIERITKINTF